MKKIIDGIDFYPVLNDASYYMICLSSMMNVLTHQNDLFQNTRTFDLLKLGWTMRYHTKKQILLDAPTRIYLDNLKKLFGVDTRKVKCKSLRQFRTYCKQSLMGLNRPLFIYAEGEPKEDNGQIIFSNDRGQHCGYVIYGIDLQTDRVLMLTNQMRLFGWSDISTVYDRLEHKLIFDPDVPESLSMPSPEQITNHLLKIIQPNLNPPNDFVLCKDHLKFFLRKAIGKPAYVNLPPFRAILGPNGIRSLAEDVVKYEEKLGGSATQKAKKFCRRTLIHKEERKIFISILVHTSSLASDKDICNEILCQGKRIESLWNRTAKGFASFYMSKNTHKIRKLYDTLIQLAQAEEHFLKTVHGFEYSLYPTFK